MKPHEVFKSSGRQFLLGAVLALCGCGGGTATPVPDRPTPEPEPVTAPEPTDAAAEADCPEETGEDALAARYESGWRTFESMYMGDEATPDQREDYVEALAGIFGAALGGNKKAIGKFPDMAKMVEAEKLPEALQQPLDEISREWVAEAFALALACAK